MIRVPSATFQKPYALPFTGLLDAGFGSQLEMECLHGLIRSHLDHRHSPSSTPPKLFEIGTHRGAGLCHFHAIAPELELHSLNVLPHQLAHPPLLAPGEIIPEPEIGGYARERGIPYTQYLADSRTFDWVTLAKAHQFDIVFIDGSHELPTVLADTLNARQILKPDGLLIWHDCKVIDEPGRQVFAALNSLDEHEFAGSLRHIQETWLAYAHLSDWRTTPLIHEPSAIATPRLPLNPKSPEDAVILHLALERRFAFARKTKQLPLVPKVVFFSDHRRPVWPADPEMDTLAGRYQTTRDPLQLTSANIVIFHLPAVPQWRRLPKKPGQIWVGVTMEPDGYYPWQASPESLATLDLLLSYHAHADVRLNFSYPRSFAEMLAPAPAKDPEHLVCAFISNAHSLSGRERLVERLEKLLPIHHYGRWHHNTPAPRPEGPEAKLAILKKYHFCLAIENSLQPDYVTEKWFDCFAAGCVPVYLGAPNILDFAPSPSSHVDLRSFARLEHLDQNIQAAARDPERYQRFFDWKHNAAPSFQKLFADPLNQMPLLRKVDHMIHQAGVPSPDHTPQSVSAMH
jgi:hypothetical protein